MLRILIFPLVIQVSILGSRAECNSCDPETNVACISDTEFQLCQSNRPSGAVYSCPTGNYCSRTFSLCQGNASLSACGDCGKCNAARTFACTGPRTFALCLGNSIPTTDFTGTCSSGHVCNLNIPKICDNELYTSATCPWIRDTTTTTTTTSTTTTTTTTTTTPAATTTTPEPTSESNTTSIDDFCRTENKFHFPPFYALPNDTECTSFVICLYNSKSWVGRIVECRLPFLPYFNARTLLCGRQKPTQPGCL